MRQKSITFLVIGKLGVPHHDGLEAIVAIIIAHFAHLLSVLVLYHLTLSIFAGAAETALVAAALHIISPAGLFLSAPFAESSCALLTFSGSLLFIKSFSPKSLGGDLLVLASGVLFGVATSFRSNGLLNGILLLEEAFRTLYNLRHGFHLRTVRRLFATGLGGIAVAVGFLLPQYIAYSEYCGKSSSSEPRPWCYRTLPSIYTFVQVHYW
jgi:GPI mannosyltransferase 2